MNIHTSSFIRLVQLEFQLPERGVIDLIIAPVYVCILLKCERRIDSSFKMNMTDHILLRDIPSHRDN